MKTLKCSLSSIVRHITRSDSANVVCDIKQFYVPFRYSMLTKDFHQYRIGAFVALPSLLIICSPFPLPCHKAPSLLFPPDQ